MKQTPPKIIDRLLPTAIWEPKTQNRFLVHLTDEVTKKEIIPTYVIKSIDRPGFYLNYDKTRCWYPIKMHIYEPIVPGGTLFDLLRSTVFSVTVRELGPVGDEIETWVLPQCRIEAIRPKQLNWSGNEMSELEVVLDWTEIIVKDGDSEFKIRK